MQMLRLPARVANLIVVAGVLAMGACGDSTDSVGSGDVEVVLDAEATIVEGLTAGDGNEDIADGWDVRFDRYIATVGHVHLSLATDPDVEEEADEIHVVDLTEVGSGGLALWRFEGLRASEWQVGYGTPGAGHGSPSRHGSVSETDFQQLVDADATYLISGELTRQDGQSCPPALLATPGDATADGENASGDPCYPADTVTFALAVRAETGFELCGVDGMSGLSVPEGGERSVAITIHGDHMFFNGFPTDSELQTVRLAQWLADCDLNLDGEVTQEELEAIAPSELGELDARYNLNQPFDSLRDEPNTMWTYLRAQLKTQGHFEGEGECQFDGLGHARHGDEHGD